ncbi:glycosyl transferase, family 2 [Thermogladius calderae 1633]|uniref:Glycosyl transferase, family 2 n=1 Tax=Thermogladius calderae (strain DSM 22663 / VKM B-2946 / 1633) TaxID=1184251 RepID=I3TCY2_THEC1|nr:glycosyltransferase [Thermogladius calderae]AFK50620.1 glycosyl transferase, family 2 [Thermogladius calderae 1633]
MGLVDALGAAGLALSLAHFAFPLAYYAYLKARWLGRPWGLRLDPGYRPRVTVVVPTYMERGLIEGKLENVYEQDYPRELLEVLVVDGASGDGTAEAAREWAGRHGDLRVEVVVEPARRGKAPALNEALRRARGEVVVVTDADSLWPRSALSEAVKWLSDERVAAVSCLKLPGGGTVPGVEEAYRGFYNTVRLAESKAWSTPVFHGELAAFKRGFLEEIGGFPTDVGADDSYTAVAAALAGLRAITPDGLACVEYVPGRGYAAWRTRRAQHLVQSFAKALRRLRGSRAPGRFKAVLLAEAYLHLVNPWLLLSAAALLAASAAAGMVLPAAALALGALLLLYKPYRAWVATQAFLVIAMVRNLWTKELVWRKQGKS